MPHRRKLRLATSEETLPIRVNTWTRLYEAIKMTVQKTTASSIKTSPAVIGLLITIAVQFGVGIWWAATINSKMEEKDREILELRTEQKTSKVWMENTREKVIKIEALLETIQRERQIDSLLKERESRGK